MTKKKMKALDYIRQGWLQGDLAKDRDGNLVDIHSPHAVAFCALGAIIRAYGSGSEESRKFREMLAPRNIIEWNNDPKRTKRQVLAAFKKAGI